MQEKSDSNTNGFRSNPESPKKLYFDKRIKKAVVIVIVLILMPVSYAGYIYAASPSVIRNPKLEHYHFRMQILVNGKAENFAEDKYQQDYAKDQCNANLPEQPIHFHDGKDQFTHIHWEGMTGGMVLKYYGWNYLEGMGNALGYKLDNLKDIQRVNTHGDFLPDIPNDMPLYIYTGSETGYKERNLKDFIGQDLEQFFGVTSNFPAHEQNLQKSSLLEKLFPKTYAHGAADDADGDDGPTFDATLRPPAAPDTPLEGEEDKLTRINNLIGNVVIFAQEGKPTDQQIKDRFNKLEPLSDSTCGG